MNERERFLKRLEAAGLVHQRHIARTILLRAVKYVALVTLVFFALDVAFHLSGRVRLFLSLSLAGVVGLLLLANFFTARVRKARMEKMARLLEDREARLGSSLINLVQLEEQARDESLAPLTRRLAAGAIEEYARSLEGVDLLSIARLPTLQREYRKAGWALAAFTAVLLLGYQVTRVEIPRFLLPYGDHPPFSLTQLFIVSPEANGAKAVYGEGIMVEAGFSGHRPRDLFMTVYNPADRHGSAVTLPMFARQKSGFTQRIDEVTTDLVVFAHTRNQKARSRERRIEVILTPRVEEGFVTVTPPPYTRLKPQESSYRFKNVRALAGSEISFRLRSNRPLSHGILGVTGSDGEGRDIRLRLTGEREVTGGLTAHETGRLQFSLVDAGQFVSAENYPGSLTVIYDLPPEVSIAEPGQNAFVIENHRLSVVVEADDDYGLTQIRFHRALNGVYSPPTVMKVEDELRRESLRLALPLLELGIVPGDVISMYAEAIDNRPEPQMGKSQVVNLTVISEEDYGLFLRRQSEIASIWDKYNKLANRMEELLREQEELAATMAAVREELEASDDPALTAPLEAKLAALAERQARMNERLAALADDMETFVRENPLYDVEHEFQKRLTQSAGTIRDALARQESATAALGMPGLIPGDALGAVREMEDAAHSMMESLREAGRKAREEILAAIEELARMQVLVLDFHRFQILYQRQTALVDQVRPYQANSHLGTEERLAFNQLAAEERQIGRELADLVEQLRFHADQAAELFPKAAASGRDLADRIEAKRLGYIADRASRAMLAGRAAESYETAERLRDEMSQFFGDEQCSFGSGPGMDISEMGHEMDRHLSLGRGMDCGDTFGQMCQSMMFGTALGMGRGWGMAGFMAMGGTVDSSPQMQMIGGEAFLNEGGLRAMPGFAGRAEQPGDGRVLTDSPEPGATETITTASPPSQAAAADNLVDEYRDVVDAYFMRITK
jgi:hypothetical protein